MTRQECRDLLRRAIETRHVVIVTAELMDDPKTEVRVRVEPYRLKGPVLNCYNLDLQSLWECWLINVRSVEWTSEMFPADGV